MATKVLVPRLGEGIDEVTIIKWLKKEGDSIKEWEPLLEVETDKVSTEIPAPASGIVLKVEMEEGQPAKVGQLLAVIGVAGEKLEASGIQTLAASAPVQRQETLRPSPVTQHTLRNMDLGFVSPVVAKIAAEHGVDLGQVKGTGLSGRITKNDVLNFVESREKRIESGSPPLTPETGIHDTLIKHTSIRKQIAAHMLESQHTSPHVLTMMEADMSRIIKHRSANKAAFEKDGVNLTFTAYFMIAIVAGLKAYPRVNSTWTDEGLLIRKDVNIGMATSLGEEGLIVPVIKGADNFSLLAMARAVNDLASRARAKKLQPEEVRDGTFTLTNHGISGSLFAFPIINQPQCGILGVGAMQKRVVVIPADGGTRDDAIAIRPLVYLSFAFDHRILDGASADWFLMKVKETLENWG